MAGRFSGKANEIDCGESCEKSAAIFSIIEVVEKPFKKGIISTLLPLLSISGAELNFDLS